MVAALQRFAMADLARQKRLEVELRADGPLTSAHTVGAAVDHFVSTMRIPDNGLRWTAFSRGLMLDSKTPLADLPKADTEWTVMPEVSAG